MRIERSVMQVETTADTDIVDLTPAIGEFVAGSGVAEGSVLVHVPGSTAGITTIEFESGAVHDLKAAIERIAPRDIEYEHDRRWGDGNGYSHVRAALIGPSLALPIGEGQPLLGTWQQVVLCDFDNRPRTRRVLLQACGSPSSPD